MNEQTRSKREILTTLAVLLAIVLIVAGIVVFNRRDNDQDSSATTSQTAPAESSTAAESSTVASGTYKDGTYQATGGYSTPGGRESIDVSLTIKDGTVTASTVEGGADGGRARTYQDQFEGGYQQYVVGKPLSEIKLSRVSGSSLTSQGFNDALAQIADQART